MTRGVHAGQHHGKSSELCRARGCLRRRRRVSTRRPPLERGPAPRVGGCRRGGPPGVGARRGGGPQWSAGRNHPARDQIGLGGAARAHPAAPDERSRPGDRPGAGGARRGRARLRAVLPGDRARPRAAEAPAPGSGARRARAGRPPALRCTRGALRAPRPRRHAVSRLLRGGGARHPAPAPAHRREPRLPVAPPLRGLRDHGSLSPDRLRPALPREVASARRHALVGGGVPAARRLPALRPGRARARARARAARLHGLLGRWAPRPRSRAPSSRRVPRRDLGRGRLESARRSLHRADVLAPAGLERIQGAAHGWADVAHLSRGLPARDDAGLRVGLAAELSGRSPLLHHRARPHGRPRRRSTRAASACTSSRASTTTAGPRSSGARPTRRSRARPSARCPGSGTSPCPRTPSASSSTCCRCSRRSGRASRRRAPRARVLA